MGNAQICRIKVWGECVMDKTMNRALIIDISGWSLVGVAAGLGVYACHLFSSKLAGPIAKDLVSLFADAL